MSAASIVKFLALAPHPEGGYFRETYRAAATLPAAALPGGFAGPRAAATAIYYLLEAGQCSRLHRIKSDEVWHFYLGDPLVIVEIDAGSVLRETVLGIDFQAGSVPQHVVPAGSWFGAQPAAGSGFALVGCTVAPGFDFADFELADPAALLAEYPRHAGWIRRLT
jgi:predicted cupin superfamily sugar epimerase